MATRLAGGEATNIVPDLHVDTKLEPISETAVVVVDPVGVVYGPLPEDKNAEEGSRAERKGLEQRLAEAPLQDIFSRINRAVDDFMAGQTVREDDLAAVETVRKMIWRGLVPPSALNSAAFPTSASSASNSAEDTAASAQIEGTVEQISSAEKVTDHSGSTTGPEGKVIHAAEEHKQDRESPETTSTSSGAIGASESKENSDDKSPESTAIGVEPESSPQSNSPADASSDAALPDLVPISGSDVDAPKRGLFLPEGVYSVSGKPEALLSLRVTTPLLAKSTQGFLQNDAGMSVQGYVYMPASTNATEAEDCIFPKIEAHFIGTTQKQAGTRRGVLQAQLYPRATGFDRATQQLTCDSDLVGSSLMFGKWAIGDKAGNVSAVRFGSIRRQSASQAASIDLGATYFDLKTSDLSDGDNKEGCGPPILPIPAFRPARAQCSNAYTLVAPHFPDLLAQRVPFTLTVDVCLSVPPSAGQTILSTPHYGIGVHMLDTGSGPTLHVCTWLRLGHEGIPCFLPKNQSKLLSPLLPWQQCIGDNAAATKDPHGTIVACSPLNQPNASPPTWTSVGLHVDWDASLLMLLLHGKIAAAVSLSPAGVKAAHAKRAASFPDCPVPLVIGADLQYNVSGDVVHIPDLDANDSATDLLAKLAACRRAAAPEDTAETLHSDLGLFRVDTSSIFDGIVSNAAVRVGKCVHSHLQESLEAAVETDVHAPVQHVEVPEIIEGPPTAEEVPAEAASAFVPDMFLEWACPNCTFINEGTDDRCVTCDKKKAKPKPAAAPSKNKPKQKQKRKHAATKTHMVVNWSEGSLVNTPFSAVQDCLVGWWPLVDDCVCTDASAGGRTLRLHAVSRSRRITQASDAGADNTVLPFLDLPAAVNTSAGSFMSHLLLPCQGSTGPAPALTASLDEKRRASSLFLRDPVHIHDGFALAMEAELSAAPGAAFTVGIHAAPCAAQLTQTDLLQLPFGLANAAGEHSIGDAAGHASSFKADDSVLAFLGVKDTSTVDGAGASEQAALIEPLPRIPTVADFPAMEALYVPANIDMSLRRVAEHAPPAAVLASGFVSHARRIVYLSVQLSVDAAGHTHAELALYTLASDSSAQSPMVRHQLASATMSLRGTSASASSTVKLNLHVQYDTAHNLIVKLNGTTAVSLLCDLHAALRHTGPREPCLLSLQSTSRFALNDSSAPGLNLLRWAFASAAHKGAEQTLNAAAFTTPLEIPCDTCGAVRNKRAVVAEPSKGGDEGSKSVGLLDTAAGVDSGITNLFGEDAWQDPVNETAAPSAVPDHVPGVDVLEGQARCKECTYLNNVGAITCEMCSSPLRKLLSGAAKAFGGEVPAELAGDVKRYDWTDATALMPTGYIMPSAGYPSLNHGKNGGSYVDAKKFIFGSNAEFKDFTYPGMPWYCRHCNRMLPHNTLRCMDTGSMKCPDAMLSTGIHEWATCGTLMCDLEDGLRDSLIISGKITPEMQAAFRVAMKLRNNNGWKQSTMKALAAQLESRAASPANAHVPAPAPAPTPAAPPPAAADPEAGWACPTCTYLNGITRSKCEICESLRPSGLRGGQPHKTYSRMSNTFRNNKASSSSRSSINKVLKVNRSNKLHQYIAAASALVAANQQTSQEVTPDSPQEAQVHAAFMPLRQRLQASFGEGREVNPGTQLDAAAGIWASNIGPIIVETSPNVQLGFEMQGHHGYHLPLHPPAALTSITGVASLHDKSRGSAPDCNNRSTRAAGFVEAAGRSRAHLICVLRAPSGNSAQGTESAAEPPAEESADTATNTSTGLTPYEFTASNRKEKLWTCMGLVCTDAHAYVGVKQPTVHVEGASEDIELPHLRSCTESTETSPLLLEFKDSVFQEIHIWMGSSAKCTAVRQSYSELLRDASHEQKLIPLGLANMQHSLVNICYQNSLMQSLFMNSELASHLLSNELCSLIHHGGAPSMTLNKHEGVDTQFLRDCGWLYGRSDATDQNGVMIEDLPLGLTQWKGFNAITPVTLNDSQTSAEDQRKAELFPVANRLQWLFARFALSARSALETHALQAALPTMYTNGKQQDVDEFLHYMADSLDTSIRAPVVGSEDVEGKPRTIGLFESFFGGETTTLHQCTGSSKSACSATNAVKESFTQLTLQFPVAFQPITGIIAIVSPRGCDVSPHGMVPDGYEIIDIDLTTGKLASSEPRIYLALTRERRHASFEVGGSWDTSKPEDLAPITDICLFLKVKPITATSKPLGNTCRINPPDLETIDIPYGGADWTLLPVNLNFTIGSAPYDAIYLGYRREQGKAALCDLTLVEQSRPNPPGYERMPTMVNPGVTGSPLQFCYVRDKQLADLRISYFGNSESGFDVCGADLANNDASTLAYRTLPSGYQPLQYSGPRLLVSYSAARLKQNAAGAVTEIKAVPAYRMRVVNDGPASSPVTPISATMLSGSSAIPVRPPGAPTGTSPSSHLHLEADDSELSGLLASGYELASEISRPVASHHILVRRGTGCPIIDVGVIRAPDYFNGLPDEDILELRHPALKSPPASAPSNAQDVCGLWTGALSHKLQSHQNLGISNFVSTRGVLLNGRFGVGSARKSCQLSGVAVPVSLAASASAPITDWNGPWAFIGSYRTEESLQWSPASFMLNVSPPVAHAPAPSVNMVGWLFDGNLKHTSLNVSQRATSFRLMGRVIDIAIVTLAEWMMLNDLKNGWELLDVTDTKMSPSRLASPAASTASTTVATPSVSVIDRLSQPLPGMQSRDAAIGSVGVGSPAVSTALFICVRREKRIYESSELCKFDHALGIVGPGESMAGVYSSHQPTAPCHPAAHASLRFALPIVDIAVYCHTSAQKDKSWAELLPEGYVVIETTPKGHSAALGSVNAATKAGQYIIFKRLALPGASAAAVQETAAAPTAGVDGAEVSVLPDVDPLAFTLRPEEYAHEPAVVDIDVLVLDAGGKGESPLQGFKKLEKTVGGSKEQVDFNASAVDLSVRTLAIKVGELQKAPVHRCPFTGMFEIPSVSTTATAVGGGTSILELVAVRELPVTVFNGQLAMDINRRTATVSAARTKLTDYLSSLTRPSPTHAAAPDFFDALKLQRRSSGIDLEAGMALGFHVSFANIRDSFVIDGPQHVVSRAQAVFDGTRKRAEDLQGATYAFGLWRPSAALPTSFAAYDPLQYKAFPLRFELLFDGSMTRAVGTYNCGPSECYPWEVAADHVCYIRYRRDLSTIYQGSQLVATNKAIRHDMGSLIKYSFGKYHLSYGNRKYCEHCHEPTEHQVSTVLTTPPKYLLTVLARMQFVEGRARKITKHVHINRILHIPSRSTDGTESQVSYALFSVIMHAGTSTDSGHYYCYCRPSASVGTVTAPPETDTWLKCNDTIISTHSWKHVLHEMKNRPVDTAYVLFYKRLDSSSAEEVSSPEPSSGREESKESDLIANTERMQHLDGVKYAPWVHRVIADNFRLLTQQAAPLFSRIHADLKDEELSE